MDTTSAVELLGSQSPHERLKAARHLARNASPDHLPQLQRARQVENVSYVKRSLDVAIGRCRNICPEVKHDPSDEFSISQSVQREIRAKAVLEVAGMLLHEIASPLGLARDAARREVHEFADSETRRHLDRIFRIVKGIEKLKCAATAPKPQEFDLAQLVREVVAQETCEANIGISMCGMAPLMIRSDPTLVGLSLSNGVRNAVEAVAASCGEPLAAGADTNAIIVNWGQTDVEYWIVVIDRGPGLVGTTESAFDIGRTNKRGHSGFGLAIVRQAMETLGGVANLLPAATGGGMRFELRWERHL